MTVRLVVAGVTVLVLVTGCGGDPAPSALATPSPTASPTPSPRASLTPRPAPSPTARVTPRPTPRVTRAARVAATSSPTPSPAARRTAAVSPPTCPRVPSVRATQVVLVVSSGSSAVLRACEKRGGVWVSVLGRMHGHVGLRGVVPAGEKREGDRATPAGVYTLGRGFGVRADPGTWFSWERTDGYDVWVDDPGSDLYNTWQRKPASGRWDSAEDLYVPGNYDYVQVIDYNTARVPGRGSAIFLHVDHQSGTFGCVTVPRSQLIALLRWERAGALIVIR
ncbi:MAG TPA: L,D-transpeptidase family protein [Mycobacteriales bacterium]|nr:L,D-transpeptidase family protein [Mycobacteriales bacterium]